MKRPLLLFILSLLAICLCASGCASFPGKTLPERTFADLAPAPEDPGKKICLVTPDMNAASDADREIFDASIAMLEKSGFFLKSPEHCTPPDAAPIQNHLKLDFQNDFKAGDMAVAVLSGIVSGLTLTIIPAYAHDSYVFTAQAMVGDKVVKEYVYREHMDSWIHLSMLFMLPEHWPHNVIRQIYDRSLMNFLYDYSHDREIQSLLANGP